MNTIICKCGQPAKSEFGPYCSLDCWFLDYGPEYHDFTTDETDATTYEDYVDDVLREWVEKWHRSNK
jgi:hypothetical protein